MSHQRKPSASPGRSPTRSMIVSAASKRPACAARSNCRASGSESERPGGIEPRTGRTSSATFRWRWPRRTACPRAVPSTVRSRATVRTASPASSLRCRKHGHVGGGEVDEEDLAEPWDEMVVDCPGVVVDRGLGCNRSGQQLVPPAAEPVGQRHLVGRTALSAMKPRQANLNGLAARARDRDTPAPPRRAADVEGAVPTAVHGAPIDRALSVDALRHQRNVGKAVARCTRVFSGDPSVAISAGHGAHAGRLLPERRRSGAGE
jgi:hypothetical protein